MGALKEVEVLADTSGVAPGQQVTRDREQPVGRIGKHRRVDHAQIQCGRERRVVQEFGHHPVMQEGQGPVDLLGREVVADRAPRVASGLIPFGRPQVELLLSRRIPGPQFRAQRLPHQMVVAEAGPLIIERHQEQVGHVNAV